MKNSIVLVPFPFDDFSSTKVRPALCLTNLISGYNHVVISFITSQIAKADELTDIQLLTNSHEFELTGLKVDSAIRLHRLVTIPENLILRKLGIIPESFNSEIEAKLRSLFELK